MTPLAPLPTADKSQYLARFIATHLTEGMDVTAIVRSETSPLALAIGAVRSTLEAHRASVRVVLMQTPAISWVSATHGLADLRLALNPRLQDAHEQLVVGDAAVWIGDCMRRDPVKRDAFQQEKVACAVTSRFAAVSFERLWAISTPVATAITLGSVPSIPHAEVSAR